MRVLGVDSNTNKIAWAIVKDGTLEAYGEIYFKETLFNNRLLVARRQLEDSVPLFGEVDYIGFEKAVRVNSVDTMIKLAEMFGVIKSVLMELKGTLVEVTPLAWQTWAGNPVIKDEKKRELVSKHPELKTRSQINNFVRAHRKQKTIDFVEKETGIKMQNDDLGDAAAISLFIYNKMKDKDA